MRVRATAFAPISDRFGAPESETLSSSPPPTDRHVALGRRAGDDREPARGASANPAKRMAVAAGALLALTAMGVFSAVMLRAPAPRPSPASATTPAAGVIPGPVETAAHDRRPDGPPLGDPPPVDVDPAGAAAESAVMLSTEEIVARSMPAVVTVMARDGFGSGFFVASDTVITNAHVIAGNDVVTLKRAGGYSRTARVESVSHDIDLAVLKLDISDFDQVVLPLADPREVTIGADVVAIGSPRGLANTVTRGIVSGMRSIDNVSMVQTDAAINPGNSGGPLLDRRGRVLGVNTMKLGRGTEGMAFAVSIQYVPRLIGSVYAPKSDRDERRDRGTRGYTENMRALAQRAGAVDANWKAFRASCQPEDAPSADHQWFALSDGRPVPHARLGELRRVARLLQAIGCLDARRARAPRGRGPFDGARRRADASGAAPPQPDVSGMGAVMAGSASAVAMPVVSGFSRPDVQC